MNLKTTASIGLAISYSFFSIGLSGENLGLPSVLTMRLISIFLLGGLLFLVLFHEGKIEIELGLFGLFIISCLLMIIIWSYVSYIYSPNKELVEVRSILEWVAIPITILIASKLIKYIKFAQFLKTIAIIQFITIITLLLWVYLNLGDITKYELIREFINTNLTIGLNRFLNGIVFLSVSSTLIVLSLIKVTRIIYAVSLINLILTLLISFSTGSRQSVIGLLSILMIVYLIKISTKFSLNYKMLFSFVAILLIAVIFVQQTGIKEWINERFILKTTEQLTSDGDRRINIYIQALNDIKDNLLFGTGPGTYHQVSVLGDHTHNGYLYTVNNMGIIPLLILIIIFISLVLKSFQIRGRVIKESSKVLFAFSVTSVVVFAFIMNIFNDLITNLAFWTSVAFLISIIDKYGVMWKFLNFRIKINR